MILDHNFDQSLESIINECLPLANWFERNQEQMAYFELTHPGCLHLEETYTRQDNIILGRMASAALTALSVKNSKLSPEEKAISAAVSIAEIYEKDKNDLSSIAKTKFHIDLTELVFSEARENNGRKIK